MSRYHGPRLRILKRLGFLPGFGLGINQKYLEKKTKSINNILLKKKKSSYIVRLKEKQKLRYNYGLTEKSLINYVKKARKQKVLTGEILLNTLEMRLDNIVFRIGYASTLPAARQLVTHGYIFLNGKKQNIPSFQCKVNDTIAIKNPNKNKPKNTFTPLFLNFDFTTQKAKIQKNVSRNDISLNINELLVIEYYSRNL